MVSLLQNSTSLRKKPGLAVSSASLTKPKRGIYFFSEYGYLSPARAQQPQPSHHPARFSAVGASGSRNPRSRSVGVPHSHNETPGSATTALQAHFQSAFTNRRRPAARPGRFPHALSAPLRRLRAWPHLPCPRCLSCCSTASPGGRLRPAALFRRLPTPLPPRAVPPRAPPPPAAARRAQDGRRVSFGLRCRLAFTSRVPALAGLGK